MKRIKIFSFLLVFSAISFASAQMPRFKMDSSVGFTKFFLSKNEKKEFSSNVIKREKDLTLGVSYELGFSLLLQNGLGLNFDFMHYSASGHGSGYKDNLKDAAYVIALTWMRPFGQSANYFSVNMGLESDNQTLTVEESNKAKRIVTNEGGAFNFKFSTHIKTYKKLYWNSNISSSFEHDITLTTGLSLIF